MWYKVAADAPYLFRAISTSLGFVTSAHLMKIKDVVSVHVRTTIFAVFKVSLDDVGSVFIQPHAHVRRPPSQKSVLRHSSCRYTHHCQSDDRWLKPAVELVRLTEQLTHSLCEAQMTASLQG